MTTDADMLGARLVAEGTWMIEAPFGGVPLMLYVIDGGSELALVDSGVASTPDAFVLPFFERLGRRPDLLVNTHAHVDHFGGNARMREAFPDLRVAAHHVDARWIEDTRRHLSEFYMQMPDDWRFEDDGAALLEMCGGNCAVDLRLEDDAILEIGSRRFRTIRTTGHSPGHIALVEDARGLAIIGDAALGFGPPTAEGTPDAPSVFYDADAYLDGARRVRDLGASLHLTGHFGAIDRPSMDRLVADSEAFVARFDRWSLEAIEDGRPRTLHEIAQAISERIPSYEFGFHIHASAQACLDRHLRAGRAVTGVEGGRRVYRLGPTA